MAICRQCGKELQQTQITEICSNCAKENIRKIFNEYPKVKQAFKESIDELKKPKNRKRMVDDTVRFMQEIQSIRKGE